MSTLEVFSNMDDILSVDRGDIGLSELITSGLSTVANCISQQETGEVNKLYNNSKYRLQCDFQTKRNAPLGDRRFLQRKEKIVKTAMGTQTSKNF